MATNKLLLAVSGTFLILGLASLIVGIVVPIVLHDQLVDEGRDISKISENDNPNEWANIPGDRYKIFIFTYHAHSKVN